MDSKEFNPPRLDRVQGKWPLGSTIACVKQPHQWQQQFSREQAERYAYAGERWHGSGRGSSRSHWRQNGRGTGGGNILLRVRTDARTTCGRPLQPGCQEDHIANRQGKSKVWREAGAGIIPTSHSTYKPCQCSVSKSLLHMGDVVMRRQMVEPVVGDLRVAQVFNPRNLLPSAFGEKCALQTPASSPISEPRKLRLELRRTEPALPGR